MRILFQNMNRCLQTGQDVILVSTIASEGSTPRGAGAHMLVNENGRICGTVGGGAIEGKCIQIAKNMLKEAGESIKRFSLSEVKDEELGMVCGGDITIHFQYVSSQDEEKRKMMEIAEMLFAQGKKTWLIIHLSEDDFSLYCDGMLTGRTVPKEILSDPGIAPKIQEVEGKQYYTELLIRSGRVYIFGGGHVAQALVPVLAAVDFRCVILEDREEFCNPDLFSGAETVKLMHPQEWEEKLPVGAEDYICVMTRGHKSDLDCQVFALRTEACYIGVIGSRRKIAATQEKLKEYGFTEEEIKRITTPIGLAIGARTPAEIAVSIAAQLIEHRAKREKE